MTSVSGKRAITGPFDDGHQPSAAWGLPDTTEAEKAAKNHAIQDATKEAIEVPFRAMETSLACMEVCKAMAEIGNPASVSDAGVGALAARSAVMGAYLNVKINAGDVEDKARITDLLARGQDIQNQAIALEHEILETVNQKL